MTENYMVVELPKENDMITDVWLNDPLLLMQYEDAFKHFNELLAKEGQQMFSMPRMNQPLRAALKDRDIELWIVKRNDELLNCNTIPYVQPNDRTNFGKNR